MDGHCEPRNEGTRGKFHRPWFRALLQCSSAGELNFLRCTDYSLGSRQILLDKVLSKVVDVAIIIVASLKYEPIRILGGRDYCYESNLRIRS